jgi:hypothetical protein
MTTILMVTSQGPAAAVDVWCAATHSLGQNGWMSADSSRTSGCWQTPLADIAWARPLDESRPGAAFTEKDRVLPLSFG